MGDCHGKGRLLQTMLPLIEWMSDPFDMVVLNQVSRYHLCILAMQHAPRLHHLTPPFIQECNDLLAKHHSYIRTNFEDMPEVRDWVWTD